MNVDSNSIIFVRQISYSLTFKCQGSTAVVLLVIFAFLLFFFTFIIFCFYNYFFAYSFFFVDFAVAIVLFCMQLTIKLKINRV